MGAIHLIRHGQASWHADDYDQLSERGVRQSALLGMAWEASDWAPTSAVSGSMKRHAQTAIAAIDASGRDSAMGGGYDVDAGWDEYDHRALTAERVAMTPREFQPLLEESLAGLDGRHPRGHRRPYADWRGGIVGSFERALDAARVRVSTSRCSRPAARSPPWSRTCWPATTPCSSGSTP